MALQRMIISTYELQAKIYGKRGITPAIRKEQKLTRPICQDATLSTTKPSSAIIIRLIKTLPLEVQSFVSLLVSSLLQSSSRRRSTISATYSSGICQSSYSYLLRSESMNCCQLSKDTQSPRPIPMAQPKTAAIAMATSALLWRLIAFELRMTVKMLMVPSRPPQMKDLRKGPTYTCSYG